MNCFERLKTIAGELNIYACPDVYTNGDKKKWITYNLADDRALGFSDNKPSDFVSYVQLHLFLPINENFFSIMKQIRTKLINNGFTSPEISTQIETDNRLRHITFVCSIIEEA